MPALVPWMPGREGGNDGCLPAGAPCVLRQRRPRDVAVSYFCWADHVAVFEDLLVHAVVRARREIRLRGQQRDHLDRAAFTWPAAKPAHSWWLRRVVRLWGDMRPCLADRSPALTQMQVPALKPGQEDQKCRTPT